MWIRGKHPTALMISRRNHLAWHDRFSPMLPLRTEREPKISESIPQVIEALFSTIAFRRQRSTGGQKTELFVALRLIKP